MIALADVGRRVERRHTLALQEGAQGIDALLQRGPALAQVAAERNRHAHGRLFLPARGQDGAHAGDPAGPASEHVLETGSRLFEEALVLARLAEHDAEHRAVTRVREV